VYGPYIRTAVQVSGLPQTLFLIPIYDHD